MRFLLIFVFLILSTIATQAQSQLVGVWVNEEKDAHVKITPDADLYQGHIVWLKQEKAQDKLGTHVFIDLEAVKKGWKGEAYSVRRDDTYSAEFFVKDEGNTLEIVISVGFFSQTQTWTRLKS